MTTPIFCAPASKRGREGANIKTVTLIVPCYNAQEHLSICLSSILAQTYSDIELIFVGIGVSAIGIGAGIFLQMGSQACAGYTVQEWLGLFHNAKQVYTNSFHGTVFSLLFQKTVHLALLAHRKGGDDRVV
ncbi:polysaccharide pyruvyl transferase family protein [Oscillospiraceae bacterium LTW-04]|nr:polysaccharide pyruvyl transferase family protein [Oscillospiraceae bacterium MB24-C1]